jgi:AraC family transcriptional regulator
MTTAANARAVLDVYHCGMKTAISGPTIAPLAGKLLRRVDFPTSMLTTTAYPPRLRLTPHAHTAAFLLFVRHGGFIEHHGQRSERCERFTCIYRPAYEEHANEFDDKGAMLIAVDLSPVWLARLAEAGFAGERFQFRSPLVDQFGDRLDAELAAPDSMSEMIIESLVTDVIVFASRFVTKRSGGSVCADRARRLIEQELASPLSLSGIAAEVGVHPVHLARQFRASQGCTVGEYIRLVRVGFVRRELAMTDKPITDIAFSAGFCDHSQLTKTFKRITGQTPTDFRAKHR